MGPLVNSGGSVLPTVMGRRPIPVGGPWVYFTQRQNEQKRRKSEVPKIRNCSTGIHSYTIFCIRRVCKIAYPVCLG